MLEFFRKYQRYFFVVIAVVIVISFSFFGTHSAMNAPQKQEDRCIGQGVDGTKIMKSELDRMTRFIWSDRADISLAEKGVMPNFFNDGVIRKDLLGTGIGILLVNAYFDELKEELTEKMNHHKGFQPYCHPSAPFISVENLWSQVLPTQRINLKVFLEESNEMNPDTFALLVNLYLGESAFPPNIMREHLLYQQNHYDLPPDPNLQRANLNVFHAQSLEEWFGQRFVELSAQFILNAGMIAKERGYKVSYEEARMDLLRRGYDTIQNQMGKTDVSNEDIADLWQSQLRHLGMNEKQAVEVWQKVMLFRRLFEDVGGAVFVDPHVYQTFYSFASKTAEVDLYHLPKALELTDFSMLMKLELYLDAVAKNRKEVLMLPRNFKGVDEIEKNCPELIEQRFLVEVAEVKMSEVAATKVTLNEMWEWQLEKENYNLLKKEFPKLDLKKEEDTEGHFAALESLSPELRKRVDQFSREKIVEAHPERIQEVLDQKHLNIREVSFSPNGKVLPFEGLESGEKLADLFIVAALKGELESDPAALAAKKRLELFTADGKTYYRFHVVDRDLTKMALTFEEAIERGILDTLLMKHLESSYPKVRTTSPALFKNEKNDWKPLSEVEKEVGRILFKDVLTKIETEVSKQGISLPEDRHENLDGFYPKYRLFPYMQIAEKGIRKLGEKSLFLKTEEESSEEDKIGKKELLSSQWSLIKENQIFKNHERSPYFSSDIFSMIEKSWSDVSCSKEGHLSFFQLQEKSMPSGNFSAEMKQGQAILSREAEKLLMTDIIEQIQEKGAIQFTHVSPERP